MTSAHLDELKAWVDGATNMELAEAVDMLGAAIVVRLKQRGVVVSEAMECYDELDLHEQRENFAFHHPRDAKRGVKYPLREE